MTLTLLAVSLNEQPLTQPITAHFDDRGGSIGRADHNTMALPDPERQISRLQAEIVASGNGFLIRNLGAANPIVVSGRWLSQHETAPLAHGDEIRIGGYLLHVDGTVGPQAVEVTRGRAMLSAAQSGTSLPPAAPVAPLRAAGGPASAQAGWAASGPSSSSNPFADLLGGGAAPPSGDPFADLLAPSRLSRPGAPSALAPPPAAAPFHARPQPLPGDDPFADLLPPPAGVQAGSAGLAARPSPAGARLPDDFDPFAAPPPPAPAPRGARPSDPFADLLAPAPAASINTLFGLDDGKGSDPLATFLATPVAPAAAGAGTVSTDPLVALFNDPGAPAPAPAPAEQGRVSALNAAYEPPRAAPAVRPAAQAAPSPLSPPPASASAQQAATVVAPRSPAPPLPVPPLPVPPLPLSPLPGAPAHEPARPAPAAALRQPPAAAPMAAATSGSDADRLWAAFCDGAGVQLKLPPEAAEQRFRDIGRVLQSAVAGSLALIQLRASTRKEMRADVTMIQARQNNPLKFSPNARVAMDALLQPAMSGFLEGPAAMDGAMQDLLAHAIGTMSGMQAALQGMLDRFAPEELEAKLVGKSVLENLLPGTRKARLWDLYLQHHGKIRDDAEENFHAVFGKAFLEAYEQQIAQLKAQRQAGKPPSA